MKLVQELLLVTLSGSLLFASSYNGANKKQKQSVVKIGQKSTKLLIQTLGKNMKKHMKKGGPVEALTFCSDKAYTLTTDEKLKNTIAKKYPEDKATGYKMGDIRGAVVVTIKK